MAVQNTVWDITPAVATALIQAFDSGKGFFTWSDWEQQLFKVRTTLQAKPEPQLVDIDADTVTPTRTARFEYLEIDTQSDSAADLLRAIGGNWYDWDVVQVRTQATGRTVRVRDAGKYPAGIGETANIYLNTPEMPLEQTHHFLVLFHFGGSWYEYARYPYPHKDNIVDNHLSFSGETYTISGGSIFVTGTDVAVLGELTGSTEASATIQVDNSGVSGQLQLVVNEIGDDILLGEINYSGSPVEGDVSQLWVDAINALYALGAHGYQATQHPTLPQFDLAPPLNRGAAPNSYSLFITSAGDAVASVTTDNFEGGADGTHSADTLDTMDFSIIDLPTDKAVFGMLTNASQTETLTLGTGGNLAILSPIVMQPLALTLYRYDPAGQQVHIFAQGVQGPAGNDGNPGLVWSGGWATATAYVVTEVVENGGSSYVCIQAHTSSANDEPGLGINWTTYWELVAAGGQDALSGDLPSSFVQTSTQQGTTSGTLVDISGMSISLSLSEAAQVLVLASFQLETVSGNQSSVMAIAVNINGTDSDEYQRALSSSIDPDIGAIIHRTNTPLGVGTHNFKLRFRRVSGNTTVGIGRAEMTVIALQGAKGDPGLVWTGSWATSTSYAVNDAVAIRGSSYICTTAHNSGSTTEPGVGASWASYWNLLASGSTTQKEVVISTFFLIYPPSGSWLDTYLYPWQGSAKMGIPTEILFLFYINSGATGTIDCRIIDLDNSSAVVAEVTGLTATGASPADIVLQSMTINASNVATGSARWLIQIQATAGAPGVHYGGHVIQFT